MLRLLDKLEPSKKGNRNKTLIVLRFITLMQKCVEHKIQDVFIRRVHFTDLYVLLLSLDIANYKAMLKQKAAEKRRKANIEVRDISQNEAIKFLKGGGGFG